MIPMTQHLGAPCSPSVAKGDRVARGQTIGSVDAVVSAPVHSPVDGVVEDVTTALTSVGTRVTSVVVKPDEEQDFERFLPVESSDDPKELVRRAGIVGMGGAAFPSVVKLTPPSHLTIHTVVLNGCECEPYLTCDHRLMLERTADVVRGGREIARLVGAERVVVGVEDNKPDAIQALRETARDPVEVMELRTRYPQGAEKQLIWTVLGKEVPKGQLPAVTGALVHNVGTAVAILDALEHRRPLIERVVTVTGSVARPGNYLTLIGTPVRELLEAAGGFAGDPGKVVVGGPMTGFALASLDVPVTKGTSGIVVMERGQLPRSIDRDRPCIRCGRCLDACPMSLQPHAVSLAAGRSDWDAVERYHGADCIECGSCAYVCPSSRPLIQLLRLGKAAVMAKGVK